MAPQNHSNPYTIPNRTSPQKSISGKPPQVGRSTSSKRGAASGSALQPTASGSGSSKGTKTKASNTRVITPPPLFLEDNLADIDGDGEGAGSAKKAKGITPPPSFLEDDLADLNGGGEGGGSGKWSFFGLRFKLFP
ncbi:uncharacterized protein MELLADRAFT_109846 [Melampsora larici-populina 98AG31]|uniref:Uncharacterized protein n=1 Tax=Melampsora larici-populina (strain 98AG31 / pathotype 3-4-7) TaxID=747676 RepID=F4RXT8_MELLP|nr:uncharacterized protein MELLADRAFT_109846 [Melampsora larici-populina 98AG31]EGG02786.1 hypothetical protein MELLADRAFT_109846 [Melampsora larici-populina 98AG31]